MARPARPARDEVELLIRSRYPCLCLVTSEEDRAEELLVQVAKALRRKLYVWTMTRGWTHEGQSVELSTGSFALVETGAARGKPRSLKLDAALDELMDHGRDRELVLYFKDLATYFDEPDKVRKLADTIALGQRWTLVFSASGVDLPGLLEKEVTLVEVPLPSEAELRELLMRHLRRLARDQGSKLRVPERLVEHVVRAALGLTWRQADCAFRLAVENDHAFTEEDLDAISDTKRQVIRKTGILEYYEHQESLGQVGGLDQLKAWLEQRQGAFSDAARAYGLPQPKGVFLLGVQGCGKSLVAKAIASHWHMPLLRMDVGALFSSFMGKSEQNMRTAFRVAESVSPAVLWIDEVEKGFAGLEGSGASDAGTSKRVFASFLTWMQEKTHPVFVVATANSIEQLPPELLRKGRFDEIFFVDLPTELERREILGIHLGRKGRDPARYDVSGLAGLAQGLSGAELEEAVVSAMYEAFPQGREFTTADLARAIQQTVPISRTMAEKIAHLREWARSRARWATTPELPVRELGT
ncbi:MAG: AAA family ATPase [Planctomycetota bacterium]